MPKIVEKILLILIDFLAVIATFYIWLLIRYHLGYFAATDQLFQFYVACLMFLFWFILFLFFGLYRSWYAQSRVDEAVAITKTVTIGCLVAFVATMDVRVDLTTAPSTSRLLFAAYWIIQLVTLTAGRIIIRTIQRKLLEYGIGRKKALIVGWNKRAHELYDEVSSHKALGYDILGFVDIQRKHVDEQYKQSSVIGTIKDIPKLVRSEGIEEILIALEGSSQKKVLEVISQSNDLPVNLKIVPDLYDIVMGYGRTNQIYGVPLIDILPEMMPEWERKIKRFIDVSVALIVLVGFSPFWILVSLLIKLESRGPVLFAQKRVGKNGRIFTVYKFRSMVHRAERETGPVWAGKEDPRITRLGKIMRKLRIDEIPQFINVLYKDMSLVGPRPERPYFVDRLKRQIPLYTRRLRAQPGITGWAQIKGGYDDTFENVKKKLEYDLFYIENMSLRMDLKIILSTFYIMLAGKGQ
ncbi:undecaprenyl-phosphate glucose phosphotransferase [candidate division KSB1 bacterium]|nr:undecaprenyl-phosphate glucose phosphotransferase [candidate division KSB1 bacterium]